MSVQMELHRIIITEMQEHQIIILRETEGERTLPIVIATPAAEAIDRRLKGLPSPRPLTHDLLATVIDELGGEITRIEINNLLDHTYFASLHVRQGGKVRRFDCRPSDAIALGAAAMLPIYVAEHVLDDAA